MAVDEQQWLDAWNSQSAGPIIETCSPDIEVHAVTLGVMGRHYAGHDGVRQWMRDIRDRFRARTRAEKVTMLSGDALMLEGTLFSRDETSGDEIQQRFAMLVHLEGEKARWIGTFFSGADARAAYESGVTGPGPG